MIVSSHAAGRTQCAYHQVAVGAAGVVSRLGRARAQRLGLRLQRRAARLRGRQVARAQRLAARLQRHQRAQRGHMPLGQPQLIAQPGLVLRHGRGHLVLCGHARAGTPGDSRKQHSPARRLCSINVERAWR